MSDPVWEVKDYISYLENIHGCRYCLTCVVPMIIESEMQVRIISNEDNRIAKALGKTEKYRCCICANPL